MTYDRWKSTDDAGDDVDRRSYGVCDCCNQAVPLGCISFVTAAGGIETHACCACRGYNKQTHIDLCEEED